jgi:hypothetical protein
MMLTSANDAGILPDLAQSSMDIIGHHVSGTLYCDWFVAGNLSIIDRSGPLSFKKAGCFLCY